MVMEVVVVWVDVVVGASASFRALVYVRALAFLASNSSNA